MLLKYTFPVNILSNIFNIFVHIRVDTYSFFKLVSIMFYEIGSFPLQKQYPATAADRTNGCRKTNKRARIQAVCSQQLLTDSFLRLGSRIYWLRSAIGFIQRWVLLDTALSKFSKDFERIRNKEYLFSRYR